MGLEKEIGLYETRVIHQDFIHWNVVRPEIFRTGNTLHRWKTQFYTLNNLDTVSIHKNMINLRHGL
ncbi:MAG: hypothetical protein ACD_34C00057G0001 [uncultured bacterium]|nr:MAG: hypothetical protein ACD_34C00057G0001 [uncultured bacterium]